MFFNQTFVLHDLAIVGLLIVLEGVLSIDNALVLGLLAKRLPKSEQAKALTLGLVGAFAFRFVAIATAQLLLKYRIVKLVGGVYLFYVAGKYFFEKLSETRAAKKKQEQEKKDAAELVERAVTDPVDPTEPALPSILTRKEPGFWMTVLVIELTDIAFAIDSILAAIALVGEAPPEYADKWHPKLWVVVTGGMLGVILMRYAATIFIRLLERFPRFETAAYLLVAVIGAKLTLDWGFNTPGNSHALDFHSPRSPAFWVFWITMLVCFCIGFIAKKKPDDDVDEKPLPPGEVESKIS
jgi:YkoY family integral membrane protein